MQQWKKQDQKLRGGKMGTDL